MELPPFADSSSLKRYMHIHAHLRGPFRLLATRTKNTLKTHYQRNRSRSQIESTLEESEERVSAKLRELEDADTQDKENRGPSHEDAHLCNDEKIASIRAETASLREKFSSTAPPTRLVAPN